MLEGFFFSDSMIFALVVHAVIGVRRALFEGCSQLRSRLDRSGAMKQPGIAR